MAYKTCCVCVYENEKAEPCASCDGESCFVLKSRYMSLSVPETVAAADPVNHPAHYTDGKVEVIEYIEDKRLGYCLGNAVKYISRAGKKDPEKEVEDLKKAAW